VPWTGLEPAHLTEPPPQDGVSTNFTTRAKAANVRMYFVSAYIRSIKNSTMKKLLISFLALIVLLPACTVVRPGETAMKQRLGKLTSKTYKGGPVLFNPFISKVIKMDTRTIEKFNVLPLPTKEGLSVKAEITLLYHIDATRAQSIYTQYGRN